ncbi:uncharacterized protein [Choristoneura fumiferana]|uniref:uncharacterized protein n=1 Tax=Choristoneura fumiferana TaxID=7141 RepID=UPI003D15EC43
MEPPPRDDGDDPPTAPFRLAPSSEVGYAQALPSSSNTLLQLLLEQQNQNMARLIEAIRPPSSSSVAIRLPEFNPDLSDADPRSWCSTVDICLTEQPLEGGALIIALSKALKGSSSTWLSHVAHSGMTWQDFKNLFLARYDSAETCAATIVHINNSRPKEGENLAAYASRLIASLMAKWKDLNCEEIAISYVLAHLAQFDGRINRLAFTTPIKTRTKLIQEVQAFSLKRKQERSVDTYAHEIKRNRMNVMPRDVNKQIQCHNCHKFGHKSVDCYSRNKKPAPNAHASSSSSFAPNSKKFVTCYRCGEEGHIAPHCAKKGGSGVGAPGKGAGVGAGGGGASSAALERRVNVCEVTGVRGELTQSDIHEDV